MICRMARILLVDDEPRIARALEFALRNTGIELSSLSDPGQLEGTIELSPPDAILLDISLAGVDGLELCRRLKQNPIFRAIPVLLLSGQTGADTKAAGFAAGADDFIGKPFVPTDLIARVQAQVARRAQAETPKQ